MNFGYISGFFDADGSISLLSIHKNENKTLQLSFSNNEREILERIQNFLENEMGLKGSISKKRARKDGHSDNFELKYTRNAALELADKLECYHPKKKFRMMVALKYYKKVTCRNGKYSPKAHSRKTAFSRLFYWKS